MKRLVFPFLLISCAAGAPDAPKAIPPTPPPAFKPPAAQHPARLIGLEVPGYAYAQTITNEGVVQVGDAGRYWLIPPKGAPVSAPFILDGPLADVRAEGKGLFILGRRGEIYVTESVLGPVIERHAAPTPTVYDLIAGRRAAFGIDGDGVVVRTLDRGVTWSRRSLPLRPAELPVAIAANDKGSVLVLVQPQRIYVSTDDGEKFSPADPIDARITDVVRDGKGDLWARSNTVGRRFDAGSWSSTDEFADLAEVVPQPWPKNERTYAVGSRFVHIKHVKGEVDDRILAAVGSGEAREPTALHVEGMGHVDVAASAYGQQVVVTVSGATGSRLFQTVNDGAAWETIGSFDHAVETAVLPGLVMIERTCGDKSCFSTRSGGSWKPIAMPADFHLGRVVTDAQRKEWYVVAPPRLFIGRDDKVEAAPIELPPGEAETATIDHHGVIRYATYNNILYRVATQPLSLMPTLYPPDKIASIGLSGLRGLADDGDRWLETNDGGEHWLPVAKRRGGVWELTCNPFGCGVGVARLGWDLPDEGGAPIASALKRTLDPPKVSPPSAPIPSLKCVSTGPTFALNGELVRTIVSDNIRAIGQKDDYSKLDVLTDKVAHFELFKAQVPKDKTSRTTSNASTHGVIVARYSFVFATGKYNPVDVELAWYRARTNKVSSVKLPALSAFRVGKGGGGAVLSLVDDGAIFLADHGDSPLFHISDAGKVTKLPRPPSGLYDDAVKVGSRIAFAGEQFVLSEDSGKTWKKIRWAAGKLGVLDGRPALLIGDTSYARGTLPLLPEKEPPLATAFDLSKPGVCDANARKGFGAEAPPPTLEAFADGVPLNGWMNLFVRATADGACAERIIASDNTTTIVLRYGSSDGWISVAREGGFDVRAATCTQS
jgi:hypothetical protein